LTIGLAQELFIAREKLNEEFEKWQKGGGGTKVPPHSWFQYCEDIGSSKQVINRWLRRWFPLVDTGLLETPLFPPGKFAVIYADPPWQ
jgi:hypothetical protein